MVNYNAYNQAMSECYRRAYYAHISPSLPCPNDMINQFTTTVPITRGTGTCKLEMRVYKKDVAQTGLKPLMAIHGGSWKYRGARFYGLESQISHFTDQGFVVFAPFYRLAGIRDGSAECNNATGEEIVTALQWVRNNQHQYGVANHEKVRLFGQSAGAHLATWLLTHQPSDVAKALLMYPPTDVKNYITQYKNFTSGASYSDDYTGSFDSMGLAALSGFFGVDPDTEIAALENVDTNSSFVQANSFPSIIANNPSSYPPAFMVHGQADKLVPSIQSVRLCSRP